MLTNVSPLVPIVSDGTGAEWARLVVAKATNNLSPNLSNTSGRSSVARVQSAAAVRDESGPGGLGASHMSEHESMHGHSADSDWRGSEGASQLDSEREDTVAHLTIRDMSRPERSVRRMTLDR